MKRQKKYLLEEDQIPEQWYNIQADMPNKPLPPLNPQTHEPLKAEDLAHIFNMECSRQELDTEHAWIDIPEEVRDMYKYTGLPRWFAPTPWRKPWTLRPTYTSRMRASTRSARTR